MAGRVSVRLATQGEAVTYSIRALVLTAEGMGNVFAGAVNVRQYGRVILVQSYHVMDQHPPHVHHAGTFINHLLIGLLLGCTPSIL